MKHLRIAVAEDNWFAAEHLRAELEALGHIVVGLARTDEELVALTDHEHPDLALVDIHLARGSDGLAAAKKVQKRFGVPAIAVTGHLTAAEARAAGLLGLLGKPFTPVGLRRVLAGAAAWLENGGEATSGAKPFLVH